MSNQMPIITISKSIQKSIQTSILPVLLTDLDKTTLYKYVSRYMNVANRYKELIDQIDNNMKHNNLNMANITIEIGNTHENTHENKHENTNSTYNMQTGSSRNKTKRKLKVKTMKTMKIMKTKHNLPGKMHQMHQLYIIAINNRYYKINENKQTNDDNAELLEIARVSGNAIFNTLKTNQISQTNIINIDKDNSKGNSFIHSLLEGLLLSAYSFLKYKTSYALSKSKDSYKLSRINIVMSSPESPSSPSSPSKLTKQIKQLQNQIKSVFLARDLINEPANKQKTTVFLDIVKQFIKDNKIPITIEIFDKADLIKMGMGLVLGVGSGSTPENDPKVVIMKYNGGNGHGHGNGHGNGHHDRHSHTPEYILLGKGITFDTGGLDIKGTRSMLEMKTDLSGAATVMAFLIGYAMNNGSKCIYTICPFAENSVGPNSTKPSDVLKAYNGRSVEIANTDAEGRLVLADCLAYAVDKYPKSILIDFATLTGQQESLSCKLFSNILSVNSEAEVEKLIKSGKEINEMLVELPIMEKHLKNLESYVADIKNVSFSCSADIIMSSLFMRQFVKLNTKWIHIDIAGPSYKANEVIKYASPEASGVGVRLLFEYFNE